MNILVNATSLRNGGGLTILQQFLEYANLYSKEKKYYIFIDPDLTLNPYDNIIYQPINKKGWLNRISWDYKGIKKWVKQKNIKIDLVISLQNTPVNFYSSIPQIIYYHQLLPLIEHTWSPFKKKERILFFYKNFYPFFVKLYLHNKCFFVVQTPITKELLCKRFNFEEEIVKVYKPALPKVKEEYENILVDKNYFHYFYPANPLVYKNHQVIIEALKRLKENYINHYKKIKVHFTFNPSEDSQLYAKIKTYQIEDSIIFEGYMPYFKVMAAYKEFDALLFPSYIETLGLPLIEAAENGLPILASSSPNIKEVIQNYDGVKFIEFNNVIGWANEIKNLLDKKVRYTYEHKSNNDWNKFFLFIDQIITKN